MTEATAVTHRSYSQVNQLRNCGEQYRLERVEHMPQRPSCPAVAGKVIHKATESIDAAIVFGCMDPVALATVAYEVAQIHMLDEMEEVHPDYADPDTWKRYGRPTTEKPKGEDIEWFREFGIPAGIRAYIDWRLATNDQMQLAVIDGFGAAIEVPFEYYLNGEKIRGYIDRVFTDKEHSGYWPLDIKSGQKPKTDEQLGIYGAALKAAVGFEPTYGFYLYGLKTGLAKLTPALDISHWTEAKLATVYGPAKQMIDAGLFIPRPGEACFSCSVTRHCDYFKAAI